MLLIFLYFVFVDNHAEFSQKPTGKTGTAQRGQELPDRLLSPLPHAPAPRQEDHQRGRVIHPAGKNENKSRTKVTKIVR